MNDLRTILGDKYDETIEKASRAYIISYEGGADLWPKWSAFADSDAPDMEDPDYCTREIVADTRRDMAAALAAVLPDLLAEANTRAEDAEAKARRFANLLGNNAKALNDVLPREVLRQKAEAWDEGHKTPWKREPDDCRCSAWSSIECACGRCGTGRIITPNPYRQEQ